MSLLKQLNREELEKLIPENTVLQYGLIVGLDMPDEYEVSGRVTSDLDSSSFHAQVKEKDIVLTTDSSYLESNNHVRGFITSKEGKITSERVKELITKISNRYTELHK